MHVITQSSINEIKRDNSHTHNDTIIFCCSMAAEIHSSATELKGILVNSSSSNHLLAPTDTPTHSQEDPHHHHQSQSQLHNDKKAIRLKWDEDNLQLTQQDRGKRQKITEPKTPYIHYNSDLDCVMTTSGGTYNGDTNGRALLRFIIVSLLIPSSFVIIV